MTLPSNNLWVHQVANELGESSNDIGRLCMSLNINKWAKFKPIARPGIAFDFSYTKESSWWGGVDGNCGLVIPNWTASNPAAEWSYVQPSGTESTPFRLGDFRGYDQSAKPPIRVGPLQTPINLLLYDKLNIQCLTNKQGNFSYLSPDDFSAITVEAGYFGVAIIKQQDDDTLAGTTTNWLSAPISEIMTIDLTKAPFTPVNLKGYKFFFFLTDVHRTSMLDINPVHQRFVIPSDANYPVVQTIVIFQQIPGGGFYNINSISDSLNGVYVSAIEGPDTTPLTTQGSVYMQVTRTAGDAATIFKENFTATTDTTFLGVPFTLNGVELYDSAKNAVSSLQLSTSTDTTFYIGLPNMLNRNAGGSPVLKTEDVTIQPKIDINYSSTYVGNSKKTTIWI